MGRAVALPGLRQKQPITSTRKLRWTCRTAPPTRHASFYGEEFYLEYVALYFIFELFHHIWAQHEISNNVVCATSNGSDRPAHTRSLIRDFASHLNILWLLSYWPRRLHRLVWVYSCQNSSLLEITCRGSSIFIICWCINNKYEQEMPQSQTKCQLMPSRGWNTKHRQSHDSKNTIKARQSVLYSSVRWLKN